MSFHLYRINELYSNPSGSLQFIELTVGNASGQHRWSGVTLSTTLNGVTHSLSFPGNLGSSATANTSVLLATQSFAAVAGVNPDFVLPDGFLFTGGGTLNFGGADILTHATLPRDSRSSVNRSGEFAAASPTNFAGQTGSLASVVALTGSAGDDSLTGTTASERIEGLDGNDTLKSGGGNDTVLGGGGDDQIFGGKGNDKLDGGPGYDYLYLGDASAGVVVDLALGSSQGGGGNDSLAGFELIFGTAFNDRFVGNDQGVGFLGLDGNDTLTGGAGRDQLEGNAGDDVIDGGDGVDTTAYYSAAFAVSVDLAAGTARGGLGNDTLRQIENVVGSVFGDTLAGSPVDNRLEGSDGNDTLHSTAGDDTLDGGSGIDAAVYTGPRATYTLRAGGDGGFSVEKPDAAGTDSLPSIERLQFSDVHLALDLQGAAGQTAKLLGAVFGPAALANKAYVGIGLRLLDSGSSYEALAALAVEATGKTTPTDVVALLWTNLVGSAPTAEQAAPFVQMLQSGTSVGALAVLAADHSLNTDNIQLAGLAQTGIEFLP